MFRVRIHIWLRIYICALRACEQSIQRSTHFSHTKTNKKLNLTHGVGRASEEETIEKRWWKKKNENKTMHVTSHGHGRRRLSHKTMFTLARTNTVYIHMG